MLSEILPHLFFTIGTMVVLIIAGGKKQCERHTEKHKDNKTDSRLLASFKDSEEMCSGPDDLQDSNSLINFEVTLLLTITILLGFNTPITDQRCMSNIILSPASHQQDSKVPD